MPSKKVLTFFLEGLMSSFPFGYLRTFCPRKSKPFSTCVMTVFVGESSSPRSCRNCSTRGLTSPSSSSCITDEIHRGALISHRLQTSGCWVLFPQDSFQPIQRRVGER